MTKCGDCIHYPLCTQYVERDETFPEIEGGCKLFKREADFVEVVRCKDCKFLGKAISVFAEAKGCMPNVSLDHFCS